MASVETQGSLGEIFPEQIQNLERPEASIDNFTPMLEALSKAYLYLIQAKKYGGMVNNIDGLDVLRKGRKIGIRDEGLYVSCQPSEQVRLESIFGFRIPINLAMDKKTFDDNTNIEFQGSEPYHDTDTGLLAVDIPIWLDIFEGMKDQLANPEIVKKFGLQPKQFSPDIFERSGANILGPESPYSFRFLYDVAHTRLVCLEMRLRSAGAPRN